MESTVPLKSNKPLTPGVTCLICTYNGAGLIPETLRHLAQQQVPAGQPWEVLLVSNASTDETLRLAPRLWAELGAPAPLRVLNEPKPGKPNALARGFAEASHEYVCIVDDDNWLAPNYLQVGREVMDANAAIGILGGGGEAVCEVEPPAWFASYALDYAAAPPATESGDVTAKAGFVYGAGCFIRLPAWRRVLAAGFESLLVKRPGVRGSSEDVEMCFALALAGYRIWFDKRLRFQHFIQSGRLTWKYLCSLYESNAGSEADLRPYRYFLQKLDTNKSFLWLRNVYNSRYYFWHAWRAMRAGNLGPAAAATGDAHSLQASYFRHLAQHYLHKGLTNDKGFERVAAFISRLQAQPSS